MPVGFQAAPVPIVKAALETLRGPMMRIYDLHGEDYRIEQLRISVVEYDDSGRRDGRWLDSDEGFASFLNGRTSRRTATSKPKWNRTKVWRLRNVSNLENQSKQKRVKPRDIEEVAALCGIQWYGEYEKKLDLQKTLFPLVREAWINKLSAEPPRLDFSDRNSLNGVNEWTVRIGLPKLLFFNRAIEFTRLCKQLENQHGSTFQPNLVFWACIWIALRPFLRWELRLSKQAKHPNWPNGAQLQHDINFISDLFEAFSSINTKQSQALYKAASERFRPFHPIKPDALREIVENELGFVPGDFSSAHSTVGWLIWKREKTRKLADQRLRMGD